MISKQTVTHTAQTYSSNTLAFSSLFIITILFCTVSVCISTSVQAENLPHRGMTKVQVNSQFGEPETKTSAVGQPPISRWHYSNYSVYFEYNHVIQSVQHGKPMKIKMASKTSAEQTTNRLQAIQETQKVATSSTTAETVPVKTIYINQESKNAQTPVNITQTVKEPITEELTPEEIEYKEPNLEKKDLNFEKQASDDEEIDFGKWGH